MKVIVLGSGIIGVTTAYFLAERGHEVTVIERRAGSGMETSFANGGQLSYSHAEPWANPAVLPKVAKWLALKDSPLVFKPQFNLGMWLWCGKFLTNCTLKKAEANTLNTLRLSLYSKKIFTEVRAKTGLDFNYLSKGILHIYKDQKSLDAAVEQANFQKKFVDCPFEVLSKEECISKEPALVNTTEKIVGGVFFPLDESGDIYAFTDKLSKFTKTLGPGVTYSYDTNIQEIVKEGDKITEVKTDKGNFKADKFVVALGSYTPLLLSKIGINLPIYPMKGYSISVPCDGYTGTPKVSITDQERKLVYSRLGDVLRVAGTAEFSGYDTSIKKERIENMKKATKSLFPLGGNFENVKEWACLRPQTPQGTPLLGKTKYNNLYLNTGHGTLGWTLGLGSSKIIADIVEDKKSDIDLKGLSL